MAEQINKEPKKKSDNIAELLYLSYLIFLVLMVFIMVKIVWLKTSYELDPQVAAYFKPRSVKNTLEPMRGAILAEDGRLLAVSTPMYQIFMDCTVLKTKNNAEEEKKWRQNARELGDGLASLYGEKSGQDWYSQIINGRENDSKYMKIGSLINHETLQKVKALPLFCNGQNKGGIIVRKFDTRQYPYGALARRTIGYVKDNSKSNGNNHIGLEGQYDYILHGEDGVEWLKPTDNHGWIRNYDSTFVKPQDGKDIRTTINIDIQDIADKAIRDVLAEHEEVEGGCSVVLDVKTGAVRAMVNLLRDSSGVLRESLNMAVGRPGEPGSVFKSTTLMSLLEDGKVTLSDEIPTNHGDVKGFKDFKRDEHIADYERATGKNTISVLHGFEISSNYVFRRLAIDNYGSDPKKMIEKLYLYKLGQAFDFDLAGLKAPTIPSPDSPAWSATDLGSVAIGYSVSETPLHIVTFYNAIANGGKMMKPYLVEDIEENGVVKEKKGPSVLNGSICSKATADTLTKALMRVTEEGTGKRMLAAASCNVAGKTGTARIAQNGGYTDAQGRVQYQGTFVGFFPAEDPRYTAIITFYSYPGTGILYGGTLPARAFRSIVDKVYALDLR